MKRLDILLVADPRFEGGVSTAMAVEIRAAVRNRLSIGLLMVRGPIIRVSLPTHPEIAEALAGGLIERIDPEIDVSARLVLVHHPSILQNPFTPRPRIRAGVVVVVLHHPVRDASGALQYDLSDVVFNGRMAFGRPVELAPVSAVVRRSLPLRPPEGASVHPDDWENLIELDRWPRRPPRPPQAGAAGIVIGRHARPHEQKWPDTLALARAAYPAPGDWRVRVLGAGPFLDRIYGEIPPGWELIPFDGMPVGTFLISLDVWVYFHSKAWLEAFGRTTLEAMASGVPVILDPLFEPLFGPAALYCRPEEVETVIRRLAETEGAWQERSDAGRRFVEERFSAERFAPRVAPLIERGGRELGSFERTSQSARTGGGKRPVLFLSSNGIGMGHLVQQLAIAERLSAELQPVFATMSYAAAVAAGRGFPVEYLPGSSVGDLAPEVWNGDLAETLLELLIRLRPRVAVVDSTMPFPGMLRALEVYREAFTIWVRRPFWREEHRPFIEAFDRFDAVIEPGELAEGFDRGPTTEQRTFAHVVAPVLHVGPADRLPRAEARRRLGLPADATVIAMQLGGGNNYPLGDLPSRIAAAVLSDPDAVLLEVRSPIRQGPAAPLPDHPRHKVATLFPFAEMIAAFDAAVLAAGYNAFHEAIAAGLPTIFVPNEGLWMDQQVNRAIWAELSGCGLVCRRDLNQPRIPELVGRLLDPAARADMTARCADFAPAVNGADQIARFVEDCAVLVRADRSPAVPP